MFPKLARGQPLSCLSNRGLSMLLTAFLDICWTFVKNSTCVICTICEQTTTAMAPTKPRVQSAVSQVLFDNTAGLIRALTLMNG